MAEKRMQWSTRRRIVKLIRSMLKNGHTTQYIYNRLKDRKEVKDLSEKVLWDKVLREKRLMARSGSKRTPTLSRVTKLLVMTGRGSGRLIRSFASIAEIERRPRLVRKIEEKKARVFREVNLSIKKKLTLEE